jgi:hypothetical protein
MSWTWAASCALQDGIVVWVILDGVHPLGWPDQHGNGLHPLQEAFNLGGHQA